VFRVVPTHYKIIAPQNVFIHDVFCPKYLKNVISVIGIATGYGLDDRGVGVRVPVGSRILSSPRRPDRLWGPPNLLSNGQGGSFPVVKVAGREADHSPPASAKVKNMWICTSPPPYAFVA
jgi:hypothetical protein